MNSQIFFGEKLRTLRIQNNLSQKDLAEKLGISTSSVGMYEQSRRQIPGKYLVKICEIFHVSSEYFFGSGSGCDFRTGLDLEVEDIMAEVNLQLINEEGLMFNGKPISDKDRELLLNAMKNGIETVLKKHKGKDSEK